MALTINQITFDCSDPLKLAAFWAAAMGWAGADDAKPDDEEVAVVSADKSRVLLFIRVPEGKAVKNRVHLDVSPTDSTRDAEVERLVGLGASVYDDRRLEDGRGWVVMRDPEGNEFCVERSEAERTT
ncbi:MAG TPA: VOC family protein [Galbitalea sp.]|jgi:predicted enzyme related to lactoylglutathione lyase|nr:VOC family protein [Galbitalea sp.]